MCGLALSFALWVALAHGALASLVGAAVIPHGDFAFDPGLLSGVATLEECTKAEALHKGTLEAASFIAKLEPDVLIFTTPHGIATSWDVSVYGNSRFHGRALVGRDLQASFGRGAFEQYTVNMDIEGAPDIATAVAESLAAAGGNATLVKGWNDVQPQELHWGEVLPLELLRRAFGGKLPPVLPLGLPLSRYNHSAAIAPDMLQLGRQLGRILNRDMSLRTAIIVSTDLAHTHWGNTSFGFSPDAAPFDDAMGRWAATLDEAALVGDATLRLVNHIYSCGYLGMVLLQGALAETHASFLPSLLVKPAAPTYYGMLAATFKRAHEQSLVLA